NAAGDGLPGLVLDRYADVAVTKVYSRAWEPHLEAFEEAVKGLGWASSMLRRFGVKAVDGKEGAEARFGKPPQTVVVTEHGMKMLVRPWTGQKTGTFLDQREHRRLVGEIAMGRRVANLFAYNGGFSLAAALGGASQVITVDIAEAAIDDARENFRLNELDPDAHVFEVADAFAWRPKGQLG
ncbi:MAG: class I SAM-dependent methyltransferase, partial [Myxococcales bacterium]|nr:class I SAM-dependent methyltransferase [Myxococcales bacterium]